MRFPTGGVPKLRSVADVIALVRRAPRLEANRVLTAIQLTNQIEHLQQADRVLRSTTHVEGLAGDVVHVLVGQQHRVDQIVNEKNVANLQTVAIDRDRPVRESLNEEMRQPAL